MLEFIESVKEKQILVYKGMLYVKQKEGSDGKVIWNCVRTRKEKSKGKW